GDVIIIMGQLFVAVIRCVVVASRPLTGVAGGPLVHPRILTEGCAMRSTLSIAAAEEHACRQHTGEARQRTPRSRPGGAGRTLWPRGTGVDNHESGIFERCVHRNLVE